MLTNDSTATALVERSGSFDKTSFVVWCHCNSLLDSCRTYILRVRRIQRYEGFLADP